MNSFFIIIFPLRKAVSHKALTDLQLTVRWIFLSADRSIFSLSLCLHERWIMQTALFAPPLNTKTRHTRTHTNWQTNLLSSIYCLCIRHLVCLEALGWSLIGLKLKTAGLLSGQGHSAPRLQAWYSFNIPNCHFDINTRAHGDAHEHSWLCECDLLTCPQAQSKGWSDV